MKRNMSVVLRWVAYSAYSLGAIFLVLGLVLSIVVQPVSAAGPPSVSFDEQDTAVCQLTPTTYTATGKVTLPAGETAILQTQWYVVHPTDISGYPMVGNPAYNEQSVTDGSTFSVAAQWPGVRPTDTVVEIHWGAILLDANTRNPISSGARLDYYWYPYVCSPPTVVPTNTPVVVPSDTPTLVVTDTSTPTEPVVTDTATPTETIVTATPTEPVVATDTPTPTSTEATPQGVTPTVTDTPTVTPTSPQGATATFTPTPTSTPRTPQGATPTFTNTPARVVTVTPTRVIVTPSGVTPTEPIVVTGSTPVSTVPAPDTTQTPSALIAVTGADLTHPIGPINLHQKAFVDTGIVLLGLALVFHGISLKISRP